MAEENLVPKPHFFLKIPNVNSNPPLVDCFMPIMASLLTCI